MTARRRDGGALAAHWRSIHNLLFLFAVLDFLSFGSCQSDSIFTPPSPATDDFTSQVNGAGKTITAAAIAGIVISIIVVVIAAGAVFYCLCILDKRSKNGSLRFPSIHIGTGRVSAHPPVSELSAFPIDVKDRLKKMQFTYAEVIEITNNLRIKLGEGGFGPVYYGKLKDGRLVAIKTLSSTSAQGTQEFLNEVEILSRAHHKNLVSLVGYCCEVNERCLIYEFMPKGTLEDRLHGLPSEQEPLTWLVRLKIAVGAAKGFNYLHNDCDPAVIHRDVKCSNILLDDKLVAKVADFGLSKLLSQSDLTHVTTGVKGTFGYLDPEYAQTKRLTEKSDVYSFGVILLELLSGKKAIMQQEGEYVHIAQWAKPYIVNRTLANLLDKKLGDVMATEAVEAVANIALRCVAYKNSERPFFQEVLQVLEAALRKELPHEELTELPNISFPEVSNMYPHTVIPVAGSPRTRDETTVPILHWTT